MRHLFATLLATLAAISIGAADDSGSEVITPILGAKFGKIIEIEGKIVDDTDTRLREHLGKKLLEVYKVGGIKLKEPTVIELAIFSFTSITVPDRGKRVRLRGYETGGFTGIPDKAFDDIPRVGTTDHYFKSRFQVTKILTDPKAEQDAPGQPPPAPAQK